MSGQIVWIICVTLLVVMSYVWICLLTLKVRELNQKAELLKEYVIEMLKERRP